MTKQEKIKTIYKAIDAIIEVSELKEADSHSLVESENSVTTKFRRLVSKIEESDKLIEK